MITRIEKGEPRAHQKIQDWRRGNEQGFFINLHTKSEGILHRALCLSHFGDTEWEPPRPGWGSLGSTPKVCSPKKEELLSLDLRVKPCTSCQPWPTFISQIRNLNSK